MYLDGAPATATLDRPKFGEPQTETAAQRKLDAELAKIIEKLPPPEMQVRQPVQTHGRPADVLAYIDAMEERGIRAILKRCHLTSQVCGEHPWSGLPRYTPEDVLEWYFRADEHEAAWPRLGEAHLTALWKGDLVPNATLRDVFQAQDPGPAEHVFALGGDVDRGLTATSLALALGERVSRRDSRRAQQEEMGDATRVSRWLGITAAPGSRGYRRNLRVFLPLDTAAAITHALALEPHTVGI